MAKSKEHHFDITAKLEMHEMKNAVIQTEREIGNRYDFKGVMAEIEWNEKAKTLSVTSSSDNKLEALQDILIAKMVKRSISSNVLEELQMESVSGGNIRRLFKVIDVIEKDEARTIISEIKKLKLKVTSVNKGDEIRVSGKKLDELQQVIAHLRTLELKAPLNFENFR